MKDLSEKFRPLIESLGVINEGDSLAENQTVATPGANP
jgi:hypothetical protein